MKPKLSNMKWALGLLIFALFGLASCNRDDRTPLEEHEIPETTHFKADVVAVSPSETAVLSVSETELVISRETDLGRKMVKGKILYSSGFEEAPEGLLVRVTDVKRSGDQLLVATEAARFVDLFEQANISFTETFGAEDTASGKTDEWKFPFTMSLDHVIYDHDGNPSTLADQLRLRGALHLTTTVDFNYQKRSGSSVASYMKLINTTEVNGSLRLVAGGELPTLNLEKTVKTQDLRPFYFPVPGLGVPLKFGHEVELSLGAVGDGQWKAEGGYSGNLTMMGGFEYKDGSFIPHFSSNKEAGPLIPVFDASGTISAFAKLKYSLWPANQRAFGAFVSAASGPELDVDINRPDGKLWKVYLLTTLGAGLNINAWGIDLSPPPLEGEFRYLLGEGGSSNDPTDQLRVLSYQYYTRGLNDCYGSWTTPGHTVDLSVVYADPNSVAGSGDLYIQNLDEATGQPDGSLLITPLYNSMSTGNGIYETLFQGCGYFGGDYGYIDAKVWVQGSNGEKSNELPIRLYSPFGGKQANGEKSTLVIQ